jgi:TonB family protein
MNSKTIAKTWIISSATDDRGGLGQNALSLLLGAGFTLGLFLGIAHYEKSAPARPPAELDDLRVVVLPVQPPPLPVTPTDAVPDFTPMAGFKLAPSDSPIKIAVSPPEFLAILPEDLSKAPPANAQTNLRLADFKPKMNFLEDAQHIYQRSEVDRAPAVLERSNPQVSSRIRDDAMVLHVTLVVVIDTSGAAGMVRLTKGSGNPQFDDLMVEYIKEWVFSPAMKGGKKVRCLIEQRITVQWKAGSPFHI